MDRPVSVVVVGAGWAGAHRHVPAFAANPLARLAGVCDPLNPHAAEHIVSAHGGAVFPSLDAVLQSDVELVSVCTPPATHTQICEQLLSAGKHVLVEKPVALDPQEASGLEKLAAERNVTLCPCHNLLFRSSVLRSAEALATMGEISSATVYQWGRRGIRTAQWTHDIAHGHFIEDGPHGLYLLRHYLGDLRVDYANTRASRTSGMHWVDVGLDAAGRPASLIVGTGSPLRLWAVVLVCENGALYVDLDRTLLVRVPADDAPRRTRSRSADVGAQIGKWMFNRLRTRRGGNGHDALIARLLQSLRDGSPPPVHAREGVETAALTQQAVALLS